MADSTYSRVKTAVVILSLLALVDALQVYAGETETDAAAVVGHLLQARQVSTSGSDTNISSSGNGGSQSAQQAASAAGNSIATGGGGDRSTPSSPAAFARLLSGTFFGSLLTVIFGGALFVQVWHYYERFGGRGQDRIWLQIQVLAILVFSLLQSGVLIHRVWDIHVAHFGNFAYPLLTVGWEIAVSFVCIGINASIIQAYYVHRLWLAFNKTKIILIVYAPLLAFTFAGGVSSAALILQAGSAANVKGEALHSFQPNSIPWEFSVVFATWLCSIAAIEISICLSLIWQLTKMSTPFFHTRHAVARLLLLSLETSIATTTFALISMILFLAIPYQFYYNISFLPIGQVSASSFLVTLMARPSIARELAQDQMMTLEGGLEAASSRAPTSIAKPVVKRMMRNEWKRRPQGDGTGVNLTVTVHEEASNGFYNEKMADADMSSLANNGNAGNNLGINAGRDRALPQWGKSTADTDSLRGETAGNAQTGNKSSAGLATNFLDAVVVGSENIGLNQMASQHTKAKNKQNGLTSAGAVATPTPGQGSSSTFGMTPRGRVVPMPPSEETTSDLREQSIEITPADDNNSDETVF